MSGAAAEALQTVEYRRDKWTMEKVPWALLFCLVGTVFVGYVDPKPYGRGILLALATWAVIVIVYVPGAIVIEQIFHGETATGRFLAAGFVAICMVALYWNRPWDLLSARYPGGPDVSAHVLGWMMITGAIGWIAFALYRHFCPPRPILTLSPAGISYHGALVRNLSIPWHEVQGVGELEITPASGDPHRYPDTTVILLSKDFYDRHIRIQRSILRGPRQGWEALFWPKGSQMQMVLDQRLFSIDHKDIREPLEARWRALGSGQPGALSDATPQPRKVYGAWSIDGTPSQAVKFLVPLIGLVAVLLHAAGLLPR